MVSLVFMIAGLVCGAVVVVTKRKRFAIASAILYFLASMPNNFTQFITKCNYGALTSTILQQTHELHFYNELKTQVQPIITIFTQKCKNYT